MFPFFPITFRDAERTVKAKRGLKRWQKALTRAIEKRVRHQIILQLLTGHEVLELIAGIKEQRNSLRHDLMEASQENLFQLQQ